MPVSRHDYVTWAGKANAVRGADLPHAKLNPGAVRAIRENREGLTAQQLAERFGVHYRTIEKIRHFETWRHV